MTETAEIAFMPGDGIGIDMAEAALAVAEAACGAVGGAALRRAEVAAGAGYFAETGRDITPDREARAEAAT